MNNLPIQKLTVLTKHFGKDLLNDHVRCDELLTDFCGEYRLEVSLLVSVLREGCAKEMLEAATDGVVADDLYVRLFGQLQKNAGIMAEYAEWGVLGVATALELEVKIPVRRQVPPPLSMMSLQEQTAHLHSPSANNPMMITPANMETTALRIVETPASIPPEHYDAVCNILLKSGNEWKKPEIWAKIDGDVKLLCAKARIEKSDIRNWMRFAWPSVEHRYEALKIREQQEIIDAGKKLQEEKKIKLQEIERHNNHVRLLTNWLENLPEATWDYDKWDDFVSNLEQPVNVCDLEIQRDNAIIHYDDYSVKDMQTGLKWHRNLDIIEKTDNLDDAYVIAAKLRKENYSGYSTWRLPTDSELEFFNKKTVVWGLPEYHKRCVVRKIDTINILEKDNTLMDCVTGLEWLKKIDTKQLIEKRSFQGAVKCISEMSNNSYLGFNDWRLPTQNEFAIFLEYFICEHLYGIGAFAYWTSSSYDSENSVVAAVSKRLLRNTGNVLTETGFIVRNNAVLSHIWPVRGC